MRAALFRQHGGPEVMEVAEVPEPVPGPGEVQVTVKAAALNHIDLWMRRGLPSMKIDLPHIPGGDVCGVVSGLGAGVAGVKEGDRVVLNPGLTCGRCRECLGGRDNLCASFRMLGEHTQGGMAEKVVVPVANLVPAPANVDDASLAAVPITFITVWHMLVDNARVKPGETVLVLGAGSGVGVAAIQIAKMFGAHVIAAASSERKLLAARGLGADETIDYASEELVAAVKRLTNRRGADIVVEHTGASTFPKSVVACARGGRIVTCGVTGGPEATLNLQMLYWNHISYLGSTMGSMEDMRRMLKAVGDFGVKPLLDSVVDLKDGPDAMARMEQGQQMGKIVLRVS